MEPSGPLPLALVTGAAHRIGRAIALELARAGYAVGLHYHTSLDRAQETARELQQAGVPAFLLQADLSEAGQIEKLFEDVAKPGYPLKVLVNSAATMPRVGLRKMPVEDWDRTLAVNLRAPWLCARAAASLMEKAGGDGVIINLSDSGAHKTWTGYPAYIISKAGLETLTRLLAREFAPGVRVNALAPGLVLPSSNFPAEQWQRLVDRLPLKTTSSPEEIARAVLFLIQSPTITGQTLVIDGGYQII